MSISDDDLDRLRRCVELARSALKDGDEPFGSILVSADGRTLFEDRNRISDGDATRHPEFAIAQWAVANLTPAQRAATTVYTSGEHCPRRVEWGAPPSPVAALPITTVAPRVAVDGPAPTLADEMKTLYEAKFRP